MRICLILLSALILSTPAFSFGGSGDGCGAGDCRDCHSMDTKEAQQLLSRGVDKVHAVDFAEMPGLFVVDAEKGGQRFPVFVDFSKQYVVSGNIIRLSDGTNITRERMARTPQPPKFVDVSRIPLDDALLLGSKSAKTRVIVFTDPECPYCGKIHDEMKKVVDLNPDIAFYIKLFPLAMHPNAYPTSISIVCAKSMELLEVSFANIGAKTKMPIPAPSCNTDAVDATIALAGEIGVRSTPTLILPNGEIMPGFKKAEDLLKRIMEAAAAAK